MRIGLLTFLIGLVVSQQAHAEHPGYAAWAEEIASRLPFSNGQLDRDRYASVASAFVAEKHAYHDAVFLTLIEKASRWGNGEMADALRRDHARRHEQVDMDVRLATDTVLSTLDPEGTGSVERTRAVAILRSLAKAADLDENGRLDADEQRLAEWSLTTGNRIADRTDSRALRLQFLEIEAADRW